MEEAGVRDAGEWQGESTSIAVAPGDAMFMSRIKLSPDDVDKLSDPERAKSKAYLRILTRGYF